MTTVKGAVGWMLNSSAILADISFSSVFFGFSLIMQAAHSLSSMIVDVVTLGCVTICRRPPNKKWIFGYGKIETVSLSSSSLFS